MQELTKRYLIDIGGMPFSLSNCSRNQYRIIARLAERVDKDILQAAVDRVVPRFPMYTVIMKKRWNPLREMSVSDMKIVVGEYDNHFTPFNLYSREPLFRVMCGEKLICLEMFHSLTDANGSVTFLNSILASYFELLGHEVDKTNITTYDSAIDDEEYEDSYFKYATKTKGNISTTKSLVSKSYKIKAETLPDRQGETVTYSFDTAQLKQAAKSYNVTLHEYLVTAICMAFSSIKGDKDKRKCVRVQIPINLRKRYASVSMRNFVASTQFDTFSTDRDDIRREIKEYMAEATSDKELKAFMYSGVSLMHGALRFFPRFIGDFLLATGEKILGEKSNSTSFSNIGVVTANLNENGVLSYEFVEGPPLYVPFLMSAISYNGICNITFSKNTTDDRYEREFLAELKRDGVVPTWVNKV